MAGKRFDHLGNGGQSSALPIESQSWFQECARKSVEYVTDLIAILAFLDHVDHFFRMTLEDGRTSIERSGTDLRMFKISIDSGQNVLSELSLLQKVTCGMANSNQTST